LGNAVKFIYFVSLALARQPEAAAARRSAQAQISGIENIYFLVRSFSGERGFD